VAIVVFSLLVLVSMVLALVADSFSGTGRTPTPTAASIEEWPPVAAPL
jgi:hypothetical protein